jgi:hypothetical protein
MSFSDLSGYEMNDRSFSLQPFPSASPLPSLKITGHLARAGGNLAIRYELRGGLAEVAIPTIAEAPARKHGLWEETCFEFFLAVKDAPGYWEFNLSPGGHWNVYGFQAYRQGMREETAFGSLPFRVRRRPDSLLLSLEVDVESIVRADQVLAVAIAAVIKLKDGGATYWALTHPGSIPDFHRRDGFIMEL